jgi:hypothetical protein
MIIVMVIVIKSSMKEKPVWAVSAVCTLFFEAAVIIGGSSWIWYAIRARAIYTPDRYELDHVACKRCALWSHLNSYLFQFGARGLVVVDDNVGLGDRTDDSESQAVELNLGFGHRAGDKAGKFGVAGFFHSLLRQQERRVSRPGVRAVRIRECEDRGDPHSDHGKYNEGYYTFY